MKVILKIAKTELRKLFFSPVAWFLAVIFMVICGFYFFENLIRLTTFQDSETRINPLFESLRRSLTTFFFRVQQTGFIGSILNNLYLFVPLLTMGLINQEFNSGTSKLLLSAPIKVHQIVWGKYLSIVIYNLFLFCFFIVIVAVAAYSIKDFDWPIALTSLLALYLLMCTYCAIGMFMSSISNYQIVSAVFTFIALFLLNQIGTFWQETDYVRSITYHLSINNRATRMGGAVVTTRDLIYFISIIFMFISFTYLQLKHGVESVSNLKKASRFVFVFLIVIAATFLSSRPGYIGYYDSSRENMYTIKPETQSLVKNLNEGELEVTLYTNLLSRSFRRARPSMRNDFIYGTWDRYIRFKSDIKFNYVDYYDVLDEDSSLYKGYPNLTLDSIAHEIAIREKAKFYNYLKPAEIRSIIDLHDEGMRAVMHLKYKDKSIFLRTFNDSEFWPDESLFAAAFKRLGSDSIPKLYVSTGNLERSVYKKGEREYSFHLIDKLNRLSLINNGFEVDTINLAHNEVPEDAYSLLIADPKVALSDKVLSNAMKYADRGGNLLILGEIEKQHVLNPLTKQFGVTLMPGTLVAVSKHETPDKIFGFATLDLYYKQFESEEIREFLKEEFNHGHIPRRLFRGATHLQHTNMGYNYTKGFETWPSQNVWSKANKLVIDSVTPIMNIQEGDYKLDSFVVAVALDKNVGNKNQRIGIVGDADFLSSVRPESHDIGRDYASWMSNSSYPIIIQKPNFSDNLFTIKSSFAKKLNVVFLWILPGTVSLIGIVLLIRRRRQ